MEQNYSATASFDILAKTPIERRIDAVVRHSMRGKLDFPAVASVELGFSEKYGYQVILVAYGNAGSWPKLIQTDYPIERPRIEVAVPASMTTQFLKDLAKNSREAYLKAKAWDKARGL